MNEKGNENLVNTNDNDSNTKLDNNIYEPSTPVILEPPRKTNNEEEKKGLKFKLNRVSKENKKDNKENRETKEIKDTNNKKETKEDNNEEEIIKNVKEEIHDEMYLKNKSNKYLIILISFFVILLIAFVIYYYLVMMPSKIFNDAINSTFLSFKEKINLLKNTQIDTTKINMNVNIKSDNSNFLELNDLNIKSSLGINLKNGNINTQIKLFKYNNSIFDTKIYLQNGKTYLNYPNLDNLNTSDKNIQFNLIPNGNDNVLKYDIRRLTSLYNVLEETKNDILNMIDDENLKRTIVFKRINDTTTIALKVNCKLNKEELTNIYYQIFSKYITDDVVLDELQIATGYDRETIINYLKKIMSQKFSLDNISVNLYTNLANTSLVSFDIKINNKYYLEVDYLNGYYKFTIIEYENSKEKLNINGYYNIIKKTLSGEAILEDNNTYSKFKYKYVNLDSSEKLFSSTFDLEFYTDTSDKPLLTLNTAVASKENVDIDTVDELNIYTLDDSENNLTLTEEELAILDELKNQIIEKNNFIQNLIFNNKIK